MNDFKKLLLCWIFGHCASDPVSKEAYDNFNQILIKCSRCEVWASAFRFPEIVILKTKYEEFKNK